MPTANEDMQEEVPGNVQEEVPDNVREAVMVGDGGAGNADKHSYSFEWRLAQHHQMQRIKRLQEEVDKLRVTVVRTDKDLKCAQREVEELKSAQSACNDKGSVDRQIPTTHQRLLMAERRAEQAHTDASEGMQQMKLAHDYEISQLKHSTRSAQMMGRR